jgi:hypothetical protein
MIFVGDVGLTMTINTSLDLTGYTAIKIYFINPAGTITSYNPDSTVVATGVLTYSTKTEAELGVAGDWSVQVVVWFGTQKPMFSDVDTFNVTTPVCNPTGVII